MPKDLSPFYPQTDRVKIRFSKEEVAEFNAKHSELQSDRSYWFEFDRETGEETDSDVPAPECTSKHAALLSEEAWKWFEQERDYLAATEEANNAPLSAQDIREFSGYLRNCTDNQVRGCYEKEKAAGRDGYVALCEAEAARRGVDLL